MGVGVGIGIGMGWFGRPGTELAGVVGFEVEGAEGFVCVGTLRKQGFGEAKKVSIAPSLNEAS